MGQLKDNEFWSVLVAMETDEALFVKAVCERKKSTARRLYRRAQISDERMKRLIHRYADDDRAVRMMIEVWF